MFHLAQINIGRLVAPIDDPKIAEFVAQLDTINQLAESSPGFIWRMQSEQGNATDIPYNDDPFMISNLSVWESIEDLQAFTYRSQHIRGKACGWNITSEMAPRPRRSGSTCLTLRRRAT
jgi:heme-degrading monooxygenase HmoA